MKIAEIMETFIVILIIILGGIFLPPKSYRRYSQKTDDPDFEKYKTNNQYFDSFDNDDD